MILCNDCLWNWHPVCNSDGQLINCAKNEIWKYLKRWSVLKGRGIVDKSHFTFYYWTAAIESPSCTRFRDITTFLLCTWLLQLHSFIIYDNLNYNRGCAYHFLLVLELILANRSVCYIFQLRDLDRFHAAEAIFKIGSKVIHWQLHYITLH